MPASAVTGETYDLVVVGGGISGLAAAHFFRAARARRAHPDPRQPRRLRRPRQAQRVHLRRADLHRLRWHPVDRQPGAVRGDRQGADRRPRHRRLAATNASSTATCIDCWGLSRRQSSSTSETFGADKLVAGTPRICRRSPGPDADRAQGGGADPGAGQREARRAEPGLSSAEKKARLAREEHRLRDADPGARSGGGSPICLTTHPRASASASTWCWRRTPGRWACPASRA